MVELLPFPRYFCPTDRDSGQLPVTRNGIRPLDPFPFTAGPADRLPHLRITDGSARTVNGLCGLVDAKHFTEGRILPHERTLAGRLDRQRTLVSGDGGALGKPVLLTVPSLAAYWSQRPHAAPVHRYRCADHRYSIYPGPTVVAPQSLAAFGTPVIADGHHRAFTHAGLAAAGLAGFSYVPVVVVGADELAIGAFLRSIAYAGTTPRLLERLAPYFTFRRLGRAVASTLPGEWLLAHRGAYYRLSRRRPVVGGTDPGWLNAVVFPEVFGIHDTRTDPRIESLDPPPQSAGALPLPDSLHDRVLLLGRPLTRAVFFREALAGRMLPPKSTRFTPRVPSGLLVWIP